MEITEENFRTAIKQLYKYLDWLARVEKVHTAPRNRCVKVVADMLDISLDDATKVVDEIIPVK